MDVGLVSGSMRHLVDRRVRDLIYRHALGTQLGSVFFVRHGDGDLGYAALAHAGLDQRRIRVVRFLPQADPLDLSPLRSWGRVSLWMVYMFGCRPGRSRWW